jgi:hypothetical protein
MKMNRNILKQKSAISIILVVAIIVIIVVVGVAAGYYYTTTQSPAASPTPSSNPTNTPSQTSSPTTSETPAVTESPSTSAAPSANPIVNFKAGAFAIYNTTTIDNGVSTVSTLNITIGEDTYNSVACWTLITTTGNASSYSVITERISKSNTSELLGNVTTGLYQDGVKIYGQEFDPSTNNITGTATQEVNPQSIISYETITVAAGTFQNCAKATITTTTATSETEVSTVWISQNVPAFGIVKSEGRINGVLSSTLELVSYGGYP